jgi:acetyl/propionyl-CoA carboxylase alpha subunit
VQGDVISNFYDSMIAKLTLWAPTREHCVGRTIAALRQFEIGGISHNIEHLLQVLHSDAFVAGHYDTGIVKTLPDLKPEPDPDPYAQLLAVVLTHRAALRGKAAAPAAKTESAWSLAARQAGLRR